MIYFTGICLVRQAGQQQAINQQLIKVLIGLRVNGVVWCRRLRDHKAYGNSVLTKNSRQVVLEFPGPCDTFLVPFQLACIGGLVEAGRFL